MINIITSFFDTSGYSIHGRELSNALDKQTEVRISTQLINGWQAQVSDRELQMIKRQPKEDEINLIITLPHQWKLHTTNGRNWAYCIWEGDRVPNCWIEEFMNPDIEYIFVASIHTRAAILNTTRGKTSNIQQIHDKIKVINHGVDLNKFYPKEKESNDFTFLANKGFRGMEDRGGIQYLIQAYLKEFKKTDNVDLILKINPAYPIADMNQIIKQWINSESPTIQVITQNMPYDKLIDIYNKCDVFVAPTRADAFNIPVLEAMACSKPVITTNFGGQIDAVNQENGWIIGGKLEEVKSDILYEGIKWLTPDMNELRRAMRDAYEGFSLKEKKAKALETARQFTWDNSASKITKLL